MLFLPREENLDTSSKTLPFMQAELIVALAGRAAEKLMCGEENVSTAAKRDLHACVFETFLNPLSRRRQGCPTLPVLQALGTTSLPFFPVCHIV